MSIKSKLSFYISILFTLLFGLVCVIIITLFSDFRKQEFEERLTEKALTSIKLLVEVKEVDNELLQIIDQNTINELYNEKTLIFNNEKKLLYSSLDDTKINWTENDLDYLKAKKSFFRKDGENEIFGLFYNEKDENYFVLISANDNYGKRKLNFLIFSLLGAYVLFIITSWIFTFYIVKKQFFPLTVFHRKIRDINDLNTFNQLELPIKGSNEINLLSNEFNHMMSRINDVYQKQREFTAQASHELRTPLARISAQLENQLQHTQQESYGLIKSMFADVEKLKELINSLLLLSKIDSHDSQNNETCRVDEAIYGSIEKLGDNYKSLKVNLEMDESVINNPNILVLKANPNLMEIAFGNLIKNAFLYSDNKSLNIVIRDIDNSLVIEFNNTGNELTEEEQSNLFQAFMRGKNGKGTDGLGLGLRIVHRILNTYNYKIEYRSKPHFNQFLLSF
ncbi:Signal transduction histidine kinase [Spirosomataceae bacterium TFI 002]|nr:Signal transduction histidine kinase [Spirosomataceae bacterium TFI 002]